ncbi:hypothetical protein PQR71_11640 [Paraburkholderia fungorum]|uniref:hypothetical protein n=1 Tax=Paraburkholderia fungorum TaxID=134537 RepID=UPI0038B7338D
MNVRSRPTVSEKTRIGRLPEGTQIEVVDIQRRYVKGQGLQTWLRVSASPGAIHPPTTSLPADNNRSEIDDTAGPPKLDEPAQKIVNCYKNQISRNRATTIREVFQCAGSWVTPRALMACSVGAKCPALPDTPSGKAILHVALKAEGNLTEDSALILTPTLIPRQPQTTDIDSCNMTANASPSLFNSCVTGKMMDVQKDQIDCFKKTTDGEKLACFAAKTGNKDYTRLIGCLGGGRPSPDKLTSCVGDKDLVRNVDVMRGCVEKAANTDAARDCLAKQLPPAQRAISNCIGRSADDYTPCLDAISPEMKKARLIKGCVDKSSNNASAANCIATQVGGDAEKFSACLTNPDRQAITVCVLGDNPNVREIQRVYNCVSNLDSSSVLYSCADRIVTYEKTRIAMACIAKAGSDRAQLAGCSASLVLPKEAARIVGCAVDASQGASSGPTSFAICVAAPAMNEEWRIAAECAVESGGNPIAWGGCTAGRLTVRELTKCLNGKVGKNCFGPNNTIVVGVRNAYSDVLHGPGQNNEIVKAVNAVGQLSGGPNSVINNPSQIWGGPGSVFNDPKQILGGEHSVFNDPGQVFDPGRWRF